jgi:hypothetical protein
MFKTMCVTVVAGLAILAGSTGVAHADPLGGKIIKVDNVLPRHTDTWTFILKGDEVTRIRLLGDGGTCLELRVYDENGNLIAADTFGFGDRREVNIRPYWTGPFMVRIKNLGPVSNTYVLGLD